MRLVHDGGTAGLGHQRRMQALNAAFKRLGLSTVVEAVAKRAAADIVVVDSYLRRADGGWVDATVTAAVDDLERDLDVDIVVDPSPGRPAREHTKAAVALVGGSYALVGPSLPNAVPAAAAEVRRVLVTLGGHDPDGNAWRLARELAVRVRGLDIASTGGPRAAADRRGIEPVETTSGLGTTIADSDLVICGGGVTLLEALALRRPTIVIAVAPNQRRAAEAVADVGAAALATPASAVDVAVSLISDVKRRQAFAEAAAAVVDRSGPSRVAAAIWERFENLFA